MERREGSGRPHLKRNKTAGRNLRTALKLLGKTWRKNVDNPNHVRNWIAWADCGLPSSATTIDGDMRLGVPEQRIAAYALCLGIAPETLCSPGANMVSLLGASAAPSGQQGLSLPPGHGERFAGHWMEHNRPSYIQELFALMHGVYRMDYLLHGVDLVHRCTLWFYEAQAHRLLLRGQFIMFGNVNSFEAQTFRWHNNLHTQYLCDNGLELGYGLTVDPLRHNIVRQRKPFWLCGTGMTDRGLASNLPITFVFRKQQLPRPEGVSPGDLWQRECRDMRGRPFTAPGEAEYEALYADVLGSEALAPGRS